MCSQRIAYSGLLLLFLFEELFSFDFIAASMAEMEHQLVSWVCKAVATTCRSIICSAESLCHNARPVLVTTVNVCKWHAAGARIMPGNEYCLCKVCHVGRVMPSLDLEECP